jgi:uncharacterized membrane protein
MSAPAQLAAVVSATVTFYEVVLWVHITAVVAAFGALFGYPLFLTVNARAPLSQRVAFHRLQIVFSQRVTGPAIAVVLIAGVYLASDAHLWSQAWVIVGLVLLAVIAGLGVTVLRRNERRLIASCEAGDEAGYAATLTVLRAWTVVTIVLIVTTIFFMTAKPFT